MENIDLVPQNSSDADTNDAGEISMTSDALAKDQASFFEPIHLLASNDVEDIESCDDHHNRSHDRKVRFSGNDEFKLPPDNTMKQSPETHVDELATAIEVTDDPSSNTAYASLSLDSTLPNSANQMRTRYEENTSNFISRDISSNLHVPELIHEDASNGMAVVVLDESEAQGSKNVDPIPFSIERKSSSLKVIPWYRQKRNQVTIIGVIATVVVVIVLLFFLIISPLSENGINNDTPVLDNCEAICSLPRSNCDNALVCRYIDTEKEDRYPCDKFVTMPSICSLVFPCTGNNDQC